MKLGELIYGMKYQLFGNDQVEVSGLSCDTKDVKEGCVFFCLNGTNTDGHLFAPKAEHDGAVALVTTRRIESNLPQIVTEDARSLMAIMAKRFYGNACDRMKIVCVVGTNGKTSTTYLLRGIFEKSGYNVGVIGTNGVFINGVKYASLLTTPDPIQLHGYFAEMSRQKVHYVIMEASAHAIFHRKLDGIRADVTVFTNFSQDHLDFFKTMAEYAKVKKSFFTSQHTKIAVVNADDALGREIVAESNIPVVTYGIDNPSDVFAIDCVTEGNIAYTVNLYDEIARVDYPLYGRFNIYNTLAASTVARVFGIKLDKIAQGIAEVKRIDGRNESFFTKDGKRIIIDFAHTPEGFGNILSYVRSSCKGRVITVFGCGGNRDRFKRPLMGKNASTYSDYIILTNDNPRDENPKSIIADIECGLGKGVAYDVIPDRRSAILLGLQYAKTGDTIAILGKGAEEYQETKGRKIPFSDFEIVKKYIEEQQ